MVLRYLDTAIGFAVVMLLLSLLVTTFVQSVVALFNLRGTNLQWGLALLLEQIDPNLAKVKKEIAKKVLMHPAVASPGLLRRPRRAAAIRIEELFRILRQLGSNSPPDQPLGQLHKLMGEPLLEAARIDQLATDVAKVVPEKAAELRAWMVAELAQPGKVVAGVSDWFDTIMDRTSQRFAMYTRWFSILAAILLTLVLRLDTPGVLNRIWSNAALREQLVGAAPLAMRMADTVRTYEERQRTLATHAIHAVRDERSDTTLKTILAGAPKLGTHQEGATWLAGALKGRSDSAEVLAAYRERMTVETDSLLTRFKRSSKEVRAALADPAIGIFQTPLPPFVPYWGDSGHWVRGLISVILLSLGAPFWYNVLKRAANLRPVVAAKVESETKAKGG